jgi:hypothetical protein
VFCHQYEEPENSYFTNFRPHHDGDENPLKIEDTEIDQLFIVMFADGDKLNHFDNIIVEPREARGKLCAYVFMYFFSSSPCDSCKSSKNLPVKVPTSVIHPFFMST